MYVCCAWTKTTRMQSSSEDLRRFSIIPNQNFKKIGKSGKWYRSDLRKSFQKFLKLFNFRNAKHSTSKILELPLAKISGKKTSDKKLSKSWVYLAKLSYVLEIWKMLVHLLCSVLEIA